MAIASGHTTPRKTQPPIEWDPLLDNLPGGVLIREGVADLVAGRVTAASLLVQIGRPRMLGLGLRVPEGPAHTEHELYDLLARSDEDSAHSRYNALLHTLVSFLRAAECVAR
jgi:hypothetical protein